MTATQRRTRRDDLQHRHDTHRRETLGWLAALNRTDRDTARYDAKLTEVAVGVRFLIALRRLLDMDDVQLAAVGDVETRLVVEAARVTHDDCVAEVARLRGWNGLEIPE